MIIWFNHRFAQACLLRGNASQVCDVAHGNLCYFDAFLTVLQMSRVQHWQWVLTFVFSLFVTDLLWPMFLQLCSSASLWLHEPCKSVQPLLPVPGRTLYCQRMKSHLTNHCRTLSNICELIGCSLESMMCTWFHFVISSWNMISACLQSVPIKSSITLQNKNI